MAAESKSEQPRETWREWFLLDANRSLVAGITVFVLFAFVTSIGLSGLVLFLQQQSLYYVYSGL